MKLKALYLSLVLLSLVMGSCSGNNTKTNDPKAASMDSISESLSNTNKELDEVTLKLEKSIEEADKELK